MCTVHKMPLYHLDVVFCILRNLIIGHCAAQNDGLPLLADVRQYLVVIVTQ